MRERDGEKEAKLLLLLWWRGMSGPKKRGKVWPGGRGEKGAPALPSALGIEDRLAVALA
jgi:hypothetical protein